MQQPTFQLSGSPVYQRPMSGTATFAAASPSSAAADELSTSNGGEEAGAERRHIVRFRR